MSGGAQPLPGTGALAVATRRLRRHPAALAGLALLALVLLPVLAAPLLSLPDPALTDPARRMLPPLAIGHLLGTDHLGRDLLARLLWGARTSIAVGALATLTAAAVGSVLGLAAAWGGRRLDGLLMRGVDVLMAFPYLLLALAIVAALGPGLANAMLAIAVANVPFFARAVRGTVLDIRHCDYIAAARLAGHGEPRIVLREVLPNLAPTLLLLMTTTLGWMVLETAGLSFLGLGAQPPAADLGSMLGEGREFLTTYPLVAVLPGLLILLLVVSINLLGDGLRDVLDPRWSPRRSFSAPAPADARLQSQLEGGASLLAVQDLGVRFAGAAGPVPAVAGVSFRLNAGECVAVVGESGCGKTLTALSLLGLLPEGASQVGSVRLAGRELMALDGAALRDLRGRRIAYVPQEPLTALDPLFRVGVQMDETLRAHGAGPAYTAAELIRMVGLDGVPGLMRRYPHEFSGGQRQRVAIALALAHGPDLLIADEATTALDVTVQREILALLRRLCDEQARALLFVSHDLALVAELCERVLVMYAGRIVEDAPAAALLHRPAHPYSAALLGATPELGRPDKPLAVLAGEPPAPGERVDGCRFAPRCPRAQRECRAVEPALDALGEHRLVRCLFPIQEAS
ncbi:MAG: dipeptide/oligopeptide/nickel ABC transporter permease/ATP-binding protein [Thiohalocapsa sp.]|uniref:dipeptide/oligopeptide/nickel ABC transporter permease/ATP-binding protein n=1 Tax=Thiohalocapsa sp. TaxID=2497641 RepID=UPI0025F811A7|nr:dipeptide/oligopeptide/nickel ABC transporter permease/ATP-binding protein [Thiohalocapsa sp.]MCG6943563.1 dipeptide/oligopeptide/nickel ABC transporter permease/ATP-binding protein [Thiohalocapsa sp.]